MLRQLSMQFVHNPVRRHRVLQIARQTLQGHANHIPMMQFRSKLPIRQIEPELVHQLEVLRPQTRRMRTQIKEGRLLPPQHNLQR